MKAFAFALFMQSALAAPASNYANPNQLSCNSPAVQFADRLFDIFTPKANKLCSSILHRSTDAKVTKTALITTTVGVTVTSGLTTTTVTSGVALTTTTLAQASTIVNLATATATFVDSITFTTTSTRTLVPTLVVTQTLPPTTTTSTSTVYINNFDVAPTALNNAKRGANLRQAYPNCPEELKNIALDVASKACECFLPPPKTKTIVSQSTSTATSSVTVPSTTTLTVPSTTSTVTSTLIVPTQIQQTTVVTVTSLSITSTTVSTTITSVTTSTSTSSSTVTAMQTATITSQYAKRFEDNGVPARTYNQYTDYITVPRAIWLDRGAANAFCANTCAARADCRFYDFIQNDPAYRSQGDTSAYCILDNGFSSQKTQSVTFLLYALAYERTSRVVSLSS